MGNVWLSADAAMALAFDEEVSPRVRALLCIAERSNPVDGARFERGELTRLLGEGREGHPGALARTSLAWLRGKGYLLPGKPTEPLRLNPAQVRGLGFGLHFITDLGNGRVVVECDCSNRFIVATDRFANDTASCGRCAVALRARAA